MKQQSEEQELIKTVIYKTNNDEIIWVPTYGNDGVFMVQKPSGNSYRTILKLTMKGMSCQLFDVYNDVMLSDGWFKLWSLRSSVISQIRRAKVNKKCR